jgi:hypothetical protein
MVREGVVVDSVIDVGVWVTGSFGAKLPYGPIVAVLGVEEFDERVERVAVCALRIGAAGARCRDDCLLVRGRT